MYVGRVGRYLGSYVAINKEWIESSLNSRSVCITTRSAV